MTLDEEYQKAIDDQRTYLLGIQAEFNKVCEAAKVEAQAKLKTIPKEDEAGQQAVLKAQKEKLETALADLKNKIRESSHGMMKKLEEIVSRKEVLELQKIEQEIQKA